VDAVKAMANQLKLQAYQAPRTTPQSSAYLKAQNQIQALDQQIKTGNAQSAENALSTATTAVKELQTQDSDGGYASLDAYA
jgi:hypothetical protein